MPKRKAREKKVSATTGLTEERKSFLENVILNEDSSVLIGMPLTPEEIRYIYDFVERISLLEYEKTKGNH